MKKEEFKNIEGSKDKMIEKVYNSIHEKVTNASLLNIMVASNVLGRGLGERKMKPIMETYPTILTMNENKHVKFLFLILKVKAIYQY